VADADDKVAQLDARIASVDAQMRDYDNDEPEYDELLLELRDLQKQRDKAHRARVQQERDAARAEGQQRQTAAEKARRDQARGQEAIDGVADIIAPTAPVAPAASPPAPPAPPTLGEIADQAAAGRGCLRSLGIPAALITLALAVVIGAILLANRGGDSETTAANVPASSCSQSGARAGNIELIACDKPASGDLASVAGHYVLTSGLDDPTGLDVHRFGGRPAGDLGPVSAAIDIDGNGSVTAGSIHTSIDQSGCHYTADGDSATGTVGSNGIGSIVFNPVHTEGGDSCQSRSETYSMRYELGIQGDDLFLCSATMASPSTCADGHAPATFTKQS
jgi:hypothetical protein